MTECVGRDVLSVQRWAVVFGGGDGSVQPVLDTGAGKWCAGSVGEHRRVWCWADSVQPAAELGGGVLPEWDGTLLAALPVEVDCGLSVQEHVADLQAGELGDAGAGVVRGGEQYGVAVPAPGGTVGCGEDRGDLFAGEIAEDGPVEPFGGDRQHPSGDRQRGRVAEGRVSHERVDRGQPGVAGPGSVAAVVLEVFEEVEHQRRVEVGQPQRGGWSSGALLEETEEQSERVAVAFHGAVAGAALLHQTPQKVILHQLGESDLLRCHDASSGWCAANASKRSATMLISSGTTDRYQ